METSNEKIDKEIDELRKRIRGEIIDFILNNPDYYVDAEMDLYIFNRDDVDKEGLPETRSSLNVRTHRYNKNSKCNRKGNTDNYDYYETARGLRRPQDSFAARLLMKQNRKNLSEIDIKKNKWRKLERKYMMKKYDVIVDNGTYHFVGEIGSDVSEPDLNIEVYDDCLVINDTEYTLPFKIKDNIEVKSLQNGIIDIAIEKDRK